MLSKDLRRAERRWRSHCVWMRRLKNDWATHGWNWNYLSAKPYGGAFRRIGLTQEASCSFWAQTTLCDCFWNPGLSGMGRFKDTPHRSCGIECQPEKYSHGLESRPIQEWRELARAYGDEAREDWHVRKRDREKVVVVRKFCVCGYSMGKTWKKVSEVTWSDRRSEEYCPSCEKRFGKRNGKIRMPA